MEMLPQGTVLDKEKFYTVYQMTQEPTLIQKAEERQSQILDADYTQVDMKSYIASLDYLDSNEKKELLATVQQFPSVFGGGLGSLKIEPIWLKLKDRCKCHILGIPSKNTRYPSL